MSFGSQFRRTVEFSAFILRKIKHEKFHNYILSLPQNHTLAILVNGPSLSQTLSKMIKNETYKNYDLMTVNFMVNDNRYEIIKPKYYIISDPMFYDTPGQENRVTDFFININAKTNWNLTLFVPYRFWKNKNWCKKFKKNIQIIPFYMETPPSNTLFFLKMAKKGIIGTCYGSVIHHAIYVGILSGYKTILLYGADHTFFDGLCVNDKNQVCRRTTHFYEENAKIEPIYYTYTGKKEPYTMSHFLYEYARIFKGHEILKKIAISRNVHIINKTPNSMIDSYEKLI